MSNPYKNAVKQLKAVAEYIDIDKNSLGNGIRQGCGIETLHMVFIYTKTRLLIDNWLICYV